MRASWVVGASVAALLGLGFASAGVASAESAQETINRLQSEGYTVTVNRIGTAPLDQCVVTSVHNPTETGQLVPYVGPGLGGNKMLVPAVHQAISVSVNCQR